ncbi:MAG TPA: hypothetical protein VN178_12270 [Rubrobacter sp.]|jgi:ElaB/YqjD/DUF883 family membrane-anchored ribosome-binding protein|nr:hypothetical protein [Rubrobacter sp.]
MESDAASKEKYAEIKGRFEAHLLRVREAIESLHRELYGYDREALCRTGSGR